MALGTPSWLSVDFAQGILRRFEGDNSIQVIDIFSKPATSKGDNYTSDMVRVLVEFSRNKGDKKVTEKRSIIVKIAPTAEGMRKQLIEKSQIFNVEINMMTNTLKKMNEMLGPENRLSGQILHVQKENPALLVIEDLAPLGYQMANRQAGLDLDHCILAIQGLARFHASSVAVCEKEPKQKDLYHKGIFNHDSPSEMSGFFVAGCNALAEQMETWPELSKKYAEKIRILSGYIYNKGVHVVRRNDNEFNVINHGDFWVNNMLFRYNDNGKPTSHIFVDFQMCIYTSPAIDLHYFLCTSPSEEVAENKTEDLLNEYVRTLSNTMKKLGCKTTPPTINDIKKALKERAMYGMIAAFTVLPIVLTETSEAKDLDEMFGADGSYNNPAYKGKIYRRMMAKRIPMYDELGLLDV